MDHPRNPEIWKGLWQTALVNTLFWYSQYYYYCYYYYCYCDYYIIISHYWAYPEPVSRVSGWALGTHKL